MSSTRALAAGLAFLARRLTQAVLVMLAVLVIAFAVRTSLGDPLREIVGEAVPEAAREQLRHALGPDAPWPLPPSPYIGRALPGDLTTPPTYTKPSLAAVPTH